MDLARSFKAFTVIFFINLLSGHDAISCEHTDQNLRVFFCQDCNEFQKQPLTPFLEHFNLCLKKLDPNKTRTEYVETRSHLKKTNQMVSQYTYEQHFPKKLEDILSDATKQQNELYFQKPSLKKININNTETAQLLFLIENIFDIPKNKLGFFMQCVWMSNTWFYYAYGVMPSSKSDLQKYHGFFINTLLSVLCEDSRFKNECSQHQDAIQHLRIAALSALGAISLDRLNSDTDYFALSALLKENSTNTDGTEKYNWQRLEAMNTATGEHTAIDPEQMAEDIQLLVQSKTREFQLGQFSFTDTRQLFYCIPCTENNSSTSFFAGDFVYLKCKEQDVGQKLAEARSAKQSIRAETGNERGIIYRLARWAVEKFSHWQPNS